MKPTTPEGPPEQTSGREDARKAIAAAHRGSKRTARVVDQHAETVERAERLHAENHFRDKFARIIRGAA